MRTLNVFKLSKGRIEYTEAIKRAVLDPKITLKLKMNGGWDYVDAKYGFIKLLLHRGQILEVTTNSDLLASEDYLYAAKFGVSRSYSLSIKFEYKPSDKKSANASEKRITSAREKWIAFCNGGSK